MRLTESPPQSHCGQPRLRDSDDSDPRALQADVWRRHILATLSSRFPESPAPELRELACEASRVAMTAVCASPAPDEVLVHYLESTFRLRALLLVAERFWTREQARWRASGSSSFVIEQGFARASKTLERKLAREGANAFFAGARLNYGGLHAYIARSMLKVRDASRDAARRPRSGSESDADSDSESLVLAIPDSSASRVTAEWVEAKFLARARLAELRPKDAAAYVFRALGYDDLQTSSLIGYKPRGVSVGDEIDAKRRQAVRAAVARAARTLDVHHETCEADRRP